VWEQNFLARNRLNRRKDSLRDPCREEFPPCLYGDQVRPLRLPSLMNAATKKDAVHILDTEYGKVSSLRLIGKASLVRSGAA